MWIWLLVKKKIKSCPKTYLRVTSCYNILLHFHFTSNIVYDLQKKLSSKIIHFNHGGIELLEKWFYSSMTSTSRFGVQKPWCLAPAVLLLERFRASPRRIQCLLLVSRSLFLSACKQNSPNDRTWWFLPEGGDNCMDLRSKCIICTWRKCELSVCFSAHALWGYCISKPPLTMLLVLIWSLAIDATNFLFDTRAYFCFMISNISISSCYFKK